MKRISIVVLALITSFLPSGILATDRGPLSLVGDTVRYVGKKVDEAVTAVQEKMEARRLHTTLNERVKTTIYNAQQSRADQLENLLKLGEENFSNFTFTPLAGNNTYTISPSYGTGKQITYIPPAERSVLEKLRLYVGGEINLDYGTPENLNYRGVQEKFAEISAKLRPLKEEAEKAKQEAAQASELEHQAEKDDLEVSKAQRLAKIAENTMRLQGKLDEKTAGQKALMNALGEQQGKTERMRELLSTKNLVKYALATAGTAGLFFLAKEGIPLLLKGKPDLVETSRISPLQKIKQMFTGTKKQKSRMHEAVFNIDLQRELTSILQQIKRVTKYNYSIRNKKNARKQEYKNMLFYGPPGTGKTMVAKELAFHSGLDYVILKGNELFSLDTQDAIKEFAKILKYVINGSRPTILFIDEAEKLFAKRSGGSGSSEAATKRQLLTNIYLSYFSGPNHPNCFTIFASNIPELDPAVMSRIAKTGRKYFGAPDLASREKMLKIYLDKFITQQGYTIDQGVISGISGIAQRIDTFVGRDIEAMAKDAQQSLLDAGEAELTEALIQKVVDEQLKSNQLLQNYNWDNVAVQ